MIDIQSPGTQLSDEAFKIINASPIPYALNDENRTITYLNPAFIHTFGYNLNDIPTLEDWWPKAYPDEKYRHWVATTWQAHIDKAKQTKSEFEPIELEIQSKDGSQKTILASAASLSGSFAGNHLVILYDITERKKSEYELYEANTLLENVINSTPDLVFVKNRQLHTILCNNAYANAVGKSREEMYGNMDIENGCDPELVMGNPDKGIRGFVNDEQDALAGKDVHNPCAPANVDGKVCVFDTHILPLRDNNKAIIGVLGVARDITKRHQAETSLIEAEQRLRLATEIAEIGIWEWNVKSNAVHWDAQMFLIYGLAPTDDGFVDYTDWRNAIFPDELQEQEAILQGTIQNQGKSKREFHIRRHDDGKIRIIQAVESTRLNKAGEVEWVVGTNRDITKNRGAEEQLRRSQKMDALGKLTGGIAHDFNNMLAVILGYTDLLESKLSSDDVLCRYTGEIISAGNRAKKLTSKLLSFSRKQPSDAKPVCINNTLQNDRHMLEKTLTANIKFELDLEDDLWDCFVDEELLGDAVLNMSINAMHAMPDGGTFKIATRNRHLNLSDTNHLSIKPGDYIKLSLMDSGTGMEEGVRQKIFEPFFSTKGDMGTGLGMSQVYGFVKQAHGDIRVSSSPLKGAKITIYLPRYEGRPVIGEATTGKTDKKKSSGQEAILVVDDEPALRELSKEILSSQGYSVFCAESVTQALNILSSEPVEMMLCDVIMPDVNGYELVQQVRQKYPQVKIQMVSGYSDNHYISEENKKLHQERLQKPFEIASLLLKVRELLDS